MKKDNELEELITVIGNSGVNEFNCIMQLNENETSSKEKHTIELMTREIVRKSLNEAIVGLFENEE